jgi:hypothetical protein
MAVLIQLQNGKIGVADIQPLQNYVQGHGAPQCHNTITYPWMPGPRDAACPTILCAWFHGTRQR